MYNIIENDIVSVMPKITNSDLMKNVLLTLINITARRSSATVACAFINAILESLKEKYLFLKYIQIENIVYHEGIPSDAIRTKPQFNSVEKNEIGKSIESIIRILCMDLEEESGLFFIQEFKDNLDMKYLSEIINYGVDLKLLRLEQKHLHEQLEKRKSLVDHQSDSSMSDTKPNILKYNWEAVASFKYRNNICFLYDKNGKLLDRLHLNKIIEYYIRTLTDFGKLVEKSDKIELTEKEYELLQMLYEIDIDKERAVFLLHVTEAEFNHILQKLLKCEFLQYISYDELKLTEKGIKFLNERKEQQEETVTTKK